MDILYLFHRYRIDVYRLAVNYTRSPQEAEDICLTVSEHFSDAYFSGRPRRQISILT